MTIESNQETTQDINTLRYSVRRNRNEFLGDIAAVGAGLAIEVAGLTYSIVSKDPSGYMAATLFSPLTFIAGVEAVNTHDTYIDSVAELAVHEHELDKISE